MTEFVAPVFTEFIWLLAGGVIALILGGYLLVQTGQGNRTHPALWGMPLGLILLAVLGGGVAGLANPDLWTGTMAAVLMRWFGCFAVLPFAGTTLLVLSGISARQSPRNFPVAAGVFLVVLAAAACTVIEGNTGGNTVFGYTRGLIYLVFGTLCAASALGTGADDRRGWAAMTGALAFPMLVAAIEGGERALVAIMAMWNTARLDQAVHRTEALPAMLDAVQGEVFWGWLALGAALLVPLVVFGVHQVRTKDRIALTALWVLWICPCMLVFGLPDKPVMAAAIEAHLQLVQPSPTM